MAVGDGGFSALLNAFDGVIPLHGHVIFMTTNHVDKLDPAFLRKGRISNIHHVGPLEDAAIRDYMRRIYPEHSMRHDVTYAPITGAELESLVGRYPDAPDKVEESLDLDPEFIEDVVTWKNKKPRVGVDVR